MLAVLFTTDRTRLEEGTPLAGHFHGLVLRAQVKASRVPGQASPSFLQLPGPSVQHYVKGFALLLLPPCFSHTLTSWMTQLMTQTLLRSVQAVGSLFDSFGSL